MPDEQNYANRKAAEKLALLCDAASWVMKKYRHPHPFDGDADDFIRCAVLLGYKPRATRGPTGADR